MINSNQSIEVFLKFTFYEHDWLGPSGAGL